MRKKINRIEFLHTLEALRPGLSPREQVAQSTCFVFKDGMAVTFNEEISCHMVSGLDKSFEAAIPAKKMAAIIGKMKEDEIEVEHKDGTFIAFGHRKNFKMNYDPNVTLPVGVIDKPGKWKALHGSFNDAIQIVSQCCKKESDKWKYMCVHIHPKWMEATDNKQVCRYRLPTGFAESVLARGESLKHVAALDMTEFSEGSAWLHFRNPSGLVLSCRRWQDTYWDLTKQLEIVGNPIMLPKKMAGAVEKAEIFTSENADNNKVLVQIAPGKMKVIGEGISGRYFEWTGIKNYNGPEIEFLVSPKILTDIITRFNECHLSENRLCIDGGKWKYIVGLYQRKKEGDS